MTRDLRPITVVLVEKDPEGLNKVFKGWFHKFTQGNMFDDHIIVESYGGLVHIWNIPKETVSIIFGG